METLVINVPDDKRMVVKQFLEELGVTIQSKTKAEQLAAEINAAIRPGPKPDMNEIVAEVRAARAGK